MADGEYDTEHGHGTDDMGHTQEVLIYNGQDDQNGQQRPRKEGYVPEGSGK